MSARACDLRLRHRNLGAFVSSEPTEGAGFAARGGTTTSTSTTTSATYSTATMSGDAVFPLLREPGSYTPFTFDYSSVSSAKGREGGGGGEVTLETWLQVFRSSVPGFKRQALRHCEVGPRWTDPPPSPESPPLIPVERSHRLPAIASTLSGPGSALAPRCRLNNETFSSPPTVVRGAAFVRLLSQ